jgi:D-sedoheptulose 7-phosphate isomerase
MAGRAAPGKAGVVAAVFDEAIALHQQVRSQDAAPIVSAAAAIGAAFADGGKLLVFGNGGSAADAQHLAAELVGRFERERAAMSALALTTDTSVLTSVGNDYGYDRVFARQVEALGRPGDVAMGITTSGASPNVLAALEAARSRGLTTVALTGRDGGQAGAMADVHINVPTASAARAQEVHRTIIHALCALIERGSE